MSKILVIAPHPDDEVLGCGGTIAKYSHAGDEVYLCVVTKAYTPEWTQEFIDNRPDEVRRANKILGINKTFFLDFPTAKIDTVPQAELNKAIQKVAEKVAPDIVYIPHQGDLMKDHRLIFESCLVATRPIKLPVKRILACEISSETEWGQHIKPFFPNVYVDITETIGAKIEAMRVYSSEIKQYPHPRSLESIENLAKKRGAEANMKFAEAFMLIREII